MRNKPSTSVRIVFHFIILLTVITPMSFSGVAHAWPWQSCDTKWKNAWSKCGRGCTQLPSNLQPDCYPDDSALRTYPQGSSDPRYHDEQRKLAEQRAIRAQERARELALIEVVGVTYDVKWQSQFSMALDIHNGHEIKTLRTTTLRCQIIINNSVELYNGYVYASPSLLPRRTARVSVEFEGRMKIEGGILRAPPDQWHERVPTISTNNNAINSIQVFCTPSNAYFF